MADYGRWTTSSSAIGAYWRKKERQQKLETQRRRQRAREVLAHQANKEYFDSNVLQRPMGLTTTKKGARSARRSRPRMGMSTRAGIRTPIWSMSRLASPPRRRRLPGRRCPRRTVSAHEVCDTHRSFFPHSAARASHGARKERHAARFSERPRRDHHNQRQALRARSFAAAPTARNGKERIRARI